MAQQSEVLGNPSYIPVLDFGFVGLVNHMGSDESITRAARVSYGQGTKKVSEDRGLIRYLLKHKHTSPFEMVEFTFHIKMPIFVARQWIRHRTAGLNEYSGRYSQMTNEMYIPALEDIKPQSTTNNQGRDGEISEQNAKGVQWFLEANNENSYKIYEVLLGQKEHTNGDELMYDPYSDISPMLSNDFEGISRELARMVLPLNTYTEMYWKMDLHNLFHFLRLRLDSHAQYEIRVFAQALYDLILPIVPIAAEAFDDYVRNATTLSAMDKELLLALANSGADNLTHAYLRLISETGLVVEDAEKQIAKTYRMGQRELKEFKQQWNINA